MASDSDLPPLYAEWMDRHLGAPIPRETDAPCLDCVMCPKGDRARTDLDVSFNPASKCCTYIPYLPNYIVGRILSDDDPAMAKGLASTNQRIDEKVAVTPLGVGISKTDRETYRQLVHDDKFGRREGFRCPHYLEKEGGLCGIWRHRPAVCATWFCRHVRGAVGMTFWKSIHRLLEGVEKSLTCWCLLELGLEIPSLARLFPPPTGSEPIQTAVADMVLSESPVDPEEYRRVWGSWQGREREFYRECAKRVQALSWEEILPIGGAQVQALARLATHAFGPLESKELPSRIRQGTFQSVATPQGGLRLRTYSTIDLIDVPIAFLNLLPHLEGRTPDEIIRDVAPKLGIRITPETLRRLLDFRVLVAGEP